MRPSDLIFDEYGMRGWAILLSGLLAIALFIGFGSAVLFALDQRSCASEAHGLGLGHRWGPLEGCLLRTPGGQYIPDSQYFINHPQP